MSTVGTQQRDANHHSAPDDGERGDDVVISLRGVSKSFPDVELFDGLNLEVRRGQSLVVMGESGSGKSVLIKLMNGLQQPDKGTVHVLGQDLGEASRSQLMDIRRRIGTMFQSYALFDSLPVVENVAFPLIELEGAARSDARARAAELLGDLGLGDAIELMPASLSGGMRKRVSLARALITNPEIVLFDEPTTGLDPVMIEFVDEMLLDAQERFDITSVIISHDMASAFKLADRMAMIGDRKIVFEGTRAEAQESEVPALRTFLDSATSRLGGEDEAHGEWTNGDPEEFGLRWNDLDCDREQCVVTVEDLEKSFDGRPVLKGSSFFVEEGQVTTVIGGSGSGKSVLMKHVLGLFEPTGGRVTVFGKDNAERSSRELKKMREEIGMLFQSAALFDSMSVVENVMFPLVERTDEARRTKPEARDVAMDVLERLRIDELAGRMPSEVSNGQRKRIGLARAIVSDPSLIIYDEPTTGLDPVMTSYVNEMIVEAQEEFGATALVVSHDMASTFRISHRVALLYRGRIIAFDSPEELRKSTHPRVREFIFAGEVESEG